MTNTKRQITVRPAAPSDHPFIYSTYLRNRWFSKENATTLKKDSWMKAQHARLERMLSQQLVLIACLPEDADVILGYRLQDGSRDFTYVKQAWRREDFHVAETLKKEALPQAAPEEKQA